MSTVEISELPPIYDRLVRERGDVVAETRKVAEQTRDRARQALDWSAVWDAHRKTEEHPFSAFG